MKAYKVVKRDGDDLVSISSIDKATEESFHFKDEAKLIYVPGVPTKPNPNCGPMCVFDSVYNALRMSYTENGEIWECDINPSTHDCIWTPIDSKQNLGVIERYYPGTILADEVILRRRIDEKEIQRSVQGIQGCIAGLT